MGWLTDWSEAAKRPKRTLAFLLVAGLACGGLIGYFRFGHSIGWAVVLGVAVAAVLTVGGYRSMENPQLVRPSSANAALRLGVMFAAIPIALIIGLATGSALAFVIVLAVGISASVALGRGGLL